MPFISQTGTASHYLGANTGTISQALVFLNQTLLGYREGIYPVIDHPGIVWEQKPDELIWEVKTDEFIYEQREEQLIWQVTTDELIYEQEEETLIYEREI